MSRRIICSLLILFIICTQSACGSKYSEVESQFMEEYYKIIQNVDSKEVDDILLKLQSKENTDILNKMNQLLQENKDIRKGNEKKFDKLQVLYTGLVDLKDAYEKWDSYDLDKQDYLNSQLNYIYVYISQLEYEKKQNSEREK